MACTYQIKNEVNSKTYIGSTMRPGYIRKYEHFSQLRKNIHPNHHLQKAFNKYGEKSFTFSILEDYKFPKHYTKLYIAEYLIVREFYLIESLNAKYNIKFSLTIGNTGFKHSEETKRKIGEANKTKNPSNKTIRKRQILELKNKGEIIQRGRKAGWKHSSEAIEKIKNRSNKEDNKLRIREMQKIATSKHMGSHLSEETKKKMINTRFDKHKLIEVYDRDGKLLHVCNFSPEASVITGVKRSAIANNLAGLSKSAGKLIFKYKVD